MEGREEGLLEIRGIAFMISNIWLKKTFPIVPVKLRKTREQILHNHFEIDYKYSLQIVSAMPNVLMTFPKVPKTFLHSEIRFFYYSLTKCGKNFSL